MVEMVVLWEKRKAVKLGNILVVMMAEKLETDTVVWKVGRRET